MDETNTPAPIVDTPASVVEAAPTPAPSPVVEATSTPTPAPAPTEATTLVGDAIKPEPAPAPAVAEASKEAAPEATQISQEGQSDEPAPPPTYEAFTLPENFSLAEDKVKQFTDVLGEFEGKTKAEHALFQEMGQKLVDFYTADVSSAVETLKKEAFDTWEKTKSDWKDSFMQDPEIGGNRWESTINAAKTFIRTYGGTPEQQAELRGVFDMSGIGNHPAMIRFLRNAGLALSEGKPLAAQTPVSAPKSKVATMYGRNS